ncbi:MAG: TIGR00153 family protein [Pseudomonadales bacterium]|nr:TIGR00153 family protein [Halioglobus sp.]MCP5121182.1 TIGR00153 family protein [Pseudomonadales bacterium]MCP5193478.1 TIGR00153 family protein [Pseudomonadales bacterium]
MAGSNILGNLFGRSPIGPIQEHMQIANQAAQLLPDLVRATAADDWDTARELHKQIEQAERAADKLKRSVRRHLPKSLFLPVPRSDLLGLVSMQDSVANTARDIAVIIMGRTMRFPEAIQESVLEYVEACTATCSQALLAIQELDELLEVGFSGREVKRVEAMLKLLDKMERRTDKMAIDLRGKLFRMESELPPVDVMFYYRVLSLMGSLADEAEAVGDRLQVLMAK